MSTSGNGTLAFWKKVATVCGGIIAASTIFGFVTSFAWQLATEPIVRSITEERIARGQADLVIIEKLDQMQQDRLDLLAYVAETTPAGRRKVAREIENRWKRK